METRSGSLDPGVISYSMQELKMDAGAIESLFLPALEAIFTCFE